MKKTKISKRGAWARTTRVELGFKSMWMNNNKIFTFSGEQPGFIYIT
jgi:hypothetical protein